MDEISEVCPVCHQDVLPAQYFCPNCGKSLREKPTPVSIALQIGLYALAVFLPPLGFWPGIKYAMRQSPQAKRVGYITIVLTAVSTILTIWAIFAMFSDYIGQINAAMSGM
jgi:hypothetical protein